ncbi:hypothetical protein QBC47DRAFT_465457 [Echria macrotheca]|uniref:Ubiquitin-like protease family profile domain-containing protein n=1 Tax=Echria macrotheca TaxID=438768 RepID=A0AAJ0B3Q6_9PEZI|nr:hypothetical protein QBC47DRAFT_465457 [Echria macrotheca]
MSFSREDVERVRQQIDALVTRSDREFLELHQSLLSRHGLESTTQLIHALPDKQKNTYIDVLARAGAKRLDLHDRCVAPLTKACVRWKVLPDDICNAFGFQAREFFYTLSTMAMNHSFVETVEAIRDEAARRKDPSGERKDYIGVALDRAICNNDINRAKEVLDAKRLPEASRIALDASQRPAKRKARKQLPSKDLSKRGRPVPETLDASSRPPTDAGQLLIEEGDGYSSEGGAPDVISDADSTTVDIQDAETGRREESPDRFDDTALDRVNDSLAIASTTPDRHQFRLGSPEDPVESPSGATVITIEGVDAGPEPADAQHTANGQALQVPDVLRNFLGPIPHYRKPSDLLAPGQWVDDTVIDFDLAFLTLANPAITHISPLTVDAGDVFRQRARITQAGDALKVALLPLLVRDNHWVLAVVDVAAKCVNVYDSLSDTASESNKAAFERLELLLDRLDLGEWKQFRRQEGLSPQQDNFDDCGVFCLAVASYLVTSDAVPRTLDPFAWRNCIRMVLAPPTSDTAPISIALHPPLRFELPSLSRESKPSDRYKEALDGLKSQMRKVYAAWEDSSREIVRRVKDMIITFEKLQK